jgi:predicted peptidase
MIRQISIFLMVMTLGFAIAGWRPRAVFAQSASATIPVLKPGIHRGTLRQAGEAPIPYAISIPGNYSPSNPVPLVLALHYGGDPTGAGLGVLTILVAPALAELGAVIVAPDSLGGGWSTAENDRAVKTLLDAVQSSYRIDPGKIVVTGFSMGGAGVWHFAGKYPERFSAAVPVAGRPPAARGGWRTPVFAIHSRNDEVVPIEPTEASIKELRSAGVRAEFIPLTGISHYETYRFVDGLRRSVPWLKETWK